MNNDPKADFIYAILAMDSYNRGYGSGIKNLENAGHLGIWELLPDSENRPTIIGGFSAGFYAIAYRNASTDETVISYRGTDFNLGLPIKSLIVDPASLFVDPDRGGSDLLNGYGIGFGLAGTGSMTLEWSGAVTLATVTARQGELAEAFYDAVAATAPSGSIKLTGHSLGGGLAGYVGTVAGSNSIVFDHMPFAAANDDAGWSLAA